MDLGDSATIAQVIALLTNLGLSGALLQQVKSSIPPPSANISKSIGPEKQVEAVSFGRWHKTADQCRSLISDLNERLAEHQDIIDANLASGDLDGGLQSGEENLV